MALSSPESLSEDQKLALVVDLLTAIHLVSASEALSVGAKTGLEMLNTYDIITGAAGNSWAFTAMGAELLGVEHEKTPAIGDVIKNATIVLEATRALKFPSPLLSIAQQNLIAARGAAGGNNSTTAGLALAGLWEKFSGVKVQRGQAEAGGETSASGAGDVEQGKVAFVGLGAMGLGMAKSIVRAGIPLVGYDLWKPSLDKFVEAGGKAAESLEAAAQNAETLVLMVINADQAEEILFGKPGSNGGVAKLLAPSASVVLSSTVPPSSALLLSDRLAALGNKPRLVDAPVSGGAARAANGDLTILVSGDDAAIAKSLKVLHACTTQAGSKEQRLCIIPGGVGMGSSAKLVNQVLAGTHVAAAAEAMAFAARLGLPLRKTLAHVLKSKGVSWMYANRIPRTVEGDRTALSAVDILVKDIGIVVSESGLLGVPVPMASTALYPFQYCSSQGRGKDDDTTIVQLWEPVGAVAHRKAEA